MLLGVTLVAISCDSDGDSQPDGPIAHPLWQSSPSLPSATSNNAVAGSSSGDCLILSALGIRGSLNRDSIHNDAYLFEDDAWQQVENTPGPARIAAAAVYVNGKFYVLGGYSVDEGFSETTYDRTDIFDPVAKTWSEGAPMPTPVDDQVAVPWKDRWIISVSGWSQTANVDAVQIYDTQTNTWAAGTPFPGTAFFGAAGAASDDEIILIDGAASSAGFPVVSQSWKGVPNVSDPTTIVWTELDPHPGLPRYRAAGGRGPGNELWFVGGTDTPYNYNGLRYDNNQAATPNSSILAYSPEDGFTEFTPELAGTMDHRGLATCSDRTYLVGGMLGNLQTTRNVWSTAR